MIVSDKFYEDQLFDNLSGEGMNVSDVQFDSCSFSNCNFSEAKILSSQFVDCTFITCNFSLTDFTQSTFNNAFFKDCKVLGVKFNLCHDFIFDVGFENCILDYSSFERRKMLKSRFIASSLLGVDFGYTDLRDAVFSDSNLNGAMFYNTKLSGADFTSAYNYTLDPNENQIKKAQFSKDGLSGLLTQYGIVIK